MTTITSIIVGLLFLLLVIVRAMEMPHSALSEDELRRRAKASDGDAARALHRETLREAILSLHLLWEYMLLVSMAMVAVYGFGWWSIPLVGALVVSIGLLARLTLIRRIASRQWPLHERALTVIVEKYSFVHSLRGFAPHQARGRAQIASREELLEIMEHSRQVLAPEEQKLVTQALRVHDLRVKDIMTPRKNVVSIKKDEVLGPLTLTALHKTGHSHLPVTHGGLDHIIGILPALELLNTEQQEEITAEQAMRRQIYYLNMNQSLHAAAQALLRTKAHLFIVVDNHEETVGIITISAIVEVLFGRDRSDKYQYEDVHAVAKLSATSSKTSLDTK